MSQTILITRIHFFTWLQNVTEVDAIYQHTSQPQEYVHQITTDCI